MKQQESSIPKFTRADPLYMSAVGLSNADLADIYMDTENVFVEFEESDTERMLDALDALRFELERVADDGVRQLRSYGVLGAPGPRALLAAVNGRAEGSPPSDFGRLRVVLCPLGDAVPLVEMGSREVPPLLHIEVNGDQHEAERRMITDVRAIIRDGMHVTSVLFGSADNEVFTFADRVAEDGLSVRVVLPPDNVHQRRRFGRGQDFTFIPPEQVLAIHELAQQQRGRRRDLSASREDRREHQAALAAEPPVAPPEPPAPTAVLPAPDPEPDPLDHEPLHVRLDDMAGVDWPVLLTRLIGSRDWTRALGTDALRASVAAYDEVLTTGELERLDRDGRDPDDVQKLVGYVVIEAAVRELDPRLHAGLFEAIAERDGLTGYRAGLAHWRFRRMRPGA